MCNAHYLSGIDNYEAKDVLRHTFQTSQLKPLSFFAGCENELTKFQGNFLLLYKLLIVNNYKFVLLHLLSFLGMVALTIFSKGIFDLQIKSKDSYANHLSAIWCQVVMQQVIFKHLSHLWISKNPAVVIGPILTRSNKWRNN